MYVIITFGDFDDDTPYGESTSVYLCQKMFPSLEDAKNAAEEYVSTIKDGRWNGDGWSVTNSYNPRTWSRAATGYMKDEADGWNKNVVLRISIYELGSPDESDKAFTRIGGSTPVELMDECPD
jgi:hypothetical protein